LKHAFGWIAADSGFEIRPSRVQQIALTATDIQPAQIFGLDPGGSEETANDVDLLLEKESVAHGKLFPDRVLD
jgi:hypothetical protein